MLKKIEEAIEYIRAETSCQPQAGIILGTGLGGLAEEIDTETVIPYTSIPHFPIPTVSGHKGQMILGKLGNKQVIAMQGRYHYYEGHKIQDIVLPVRVMKWLGIKLLILSNASGGVNPDYDIGDIMIVEDHINLMSTNPLIGPNPDEIGSRFPDMSEAYDQNIIQKAIQIAQDQNIKIKKGVLAAVTGPCFETPAEYKYIRTIGADTVGMSIIPEVIAARHMSLKCFALSVISDLGVPDKITQVSHEEVMKAAGKVEPEMTKLITRLLETISI